MILTVEDGTGVVIANSYLTVQEADDMLSINIHSTWKMLDEPTKERLLMFASRRLDMRARWAGKKMWETSGLAWPRCGVRDREGFLVPDDSVPTAVKLATATLANHLITGDPDTVNSSSNLSSLQVDVVELRFDTNKSPEKYPSEIKFILAGLASVAMGKGGPKRIVMH